MIAQEAIIPMRLSNNITGTQQARSKWETPYAGEVLDVAGFAETLGTGAGSSTDIQLRNETDGNKDILSTVGAFEVDNATGLLEGEVIEDINADFAQNDVICVDVDAVTTGVPAADAVIYVTVVLFVDDL